MDNLCVLKELARTYSGIASVDEIMHSVPRKTYSSLAELDKFYENDVNSLLLFFHLTTEIL